MGHLPDYQRTGWSFLQRGLKQSSLLPWLWPTCYRI